MNNIQFKLPNEEINKIQEALKPLGYAIFGYLEQNRPSNIVLHLAPLNCYADYSKVDFDTDKLE